jgi:hypothetical protein
MLQLIPALLLILLQSGAEPDTARVRSHALSLMMGCQVRAEICVDLDKAVGENLSDVQVQVLLGILAEEPTQAEPPVERPREASPIPSVDERLPLSTTPSSVRSRDGPARS